MGSWFSSLFDIPKIKRLNLTRKRKDNSSPVHKSSKGIIAELFQQMHNNGINFSNSHSHPHRSRS
jgi:hypothetical protein